MPPSASFPGNVSRRGLLGAASLAVAWSVLPFEPDPAHASKGCPQEVEAPNPGLGSAPAQSLESWGHPFSQRINVSRFYGGNYCEYTPNPGPHRGIDYPWQGGTSVHSVAAGVVEYAGWKTGDQAWSWAGYHVVVRHASGYRSLYAHMSSLAVQTGTTVGRGTKVGEVGRTGGDWGNHLHLEIWSSGSRSSNVDPYRLVHAAPLAGSSGTAFDNTEDAMAYPIKVNQHLFLISPGFIKHFNDAVAAELARNITVNPDEWIILTPAQFLTQLDAFGVPRDVVDVNNGKVQDPSTGTLVAGGMWSWARAAFEDTKKIRAKLGA